MHRIRERVNAGLARARAQEGRSHAFLSLGSPVVRPGFAACHVPVDPPQRMARQQGRSPTGL